jgi:hypothetical protein
MVIEVRTEELMAAAEQLRRIGGRVTSYGGQLDARVRRVAGELDEGVSSSLATAWSEVAGAMEDLAVGFERYGGALAEVAERYRGLESDVLPRRAR